MKITQSKFYCTLCGKEGIPLIRNQGQQREPGHLKKLYCMNCKKEVNHAEVRDIGGYTYDDFQREYKLGRFVGGKRIEINSLAICTNTKCPFNINGRCWNSNHSNKCKHRLYEREVD